MRGGGGGLTVLGMCRPQGCLLVNFCIFKGFFSTNSCIFEGVFFQSLNFLANFCIFEGVFSTNFCIFKGVFLANFCIFKGAFQPISVYSRVFFLANFCIFKGCFLPIAHFWPKLYIYRCVFCQCCIFKVMVWASSPHTQPKFWSSAPPPPRADNPLYLHFVRILSLYIFYTDTIPATNLTHR